MEGTVLDGRYRIEACLGKGGMGSVYRARHVQVGRLFAVKVLNDALAEKTDLVARFLREAELAGSLRHAHVVPVVDTGVMDDGKPYLVMEHAPGDRLTFLLEAGPMSETRALALTRQLCDGLQHAHDMGVIHRDFKPDNVLVERLPDGSVHARIIDFGVAIPSEHASDTDGERLTTKGVVVGTPHYMAPEQARGLAVDHRMDLFALGLLLYEMLCGRTPFEGTGAEVARAHLTLETPAMGVRAPAVRVDPILEALVRSLLAKQPENRPRSARAVRELIELYERDRDAAAEVLGLCATSELAPARPARRHRRLAIAVLVGASVFGIGLFLALAPHPRAERASAEPPRAIAAVEALPVPVAPVPVLLPPLPAPVQPPISTKSPPHRARAIRATPPPPTALRSPALRPAASSAVPTTPTPAELAQLYSEVGRELRDAPRDRADLLWTRYRRIRVNDALATREKRTEAVAVLEHLRSELRR